MEDFLFSLALLGIGIPEQLVQMLCIDSGVCILWSEWHFDPHIVVNPVRLIQYSFEWLGV